MESEQHRSSSKPESSVDYAALLESAQAEHEAAPDIAERANFQGNWMNLQRERMADADFRFKFEQFRKDHMDSMRDGSPGVFDKPKQYKAHYEGQLDNFEANLEHVYASVSVTEASPNDVKKLGTGNIGRPGTVFLNGESDGATLEGRQKDIIAAHEAYHGMVDTQGKDSDLVRGAFDLELYGEKMAEAIAQGSSKNPNYLHNADELMARMAQLKNYYGMKSEQPFTKEHLEYAREHYVPDTGLDNDMSTFMGIVTDETEDRFLHLMNTLPV